MKSFKKLIAQVAVLAMLATTMTGCLSPSSVDEGFEGVFVYQPWIFGHGGVDPVPMSTGLSWTVWSTSVKRINIKPFNIDEKFDDLVTEDNNPVDFTIHMTFKHMANGESGGTPKLVEKFGENWYANKVREPLRNSVRSFTKSHQMFAMTTDKKVSDELEIICKNEIEKYLKDSGIPTDLVLVTVGRVMPPHAVVNATIETAVQKQGVKTESERALKEMSRATAEKARAEADNAYKNELKLDSNQYLAMKKLDNERAAIDAAADGKIGLTLIMGNAQPMFNVK